MDFAGVYWEPISTLWPAIAIAVIEVVRSAGSGIWYFRKTERTFADVI